MNSRVLPETIDRSSTLASNFQSSLGGGSIITSESALYRGGTRERASRSMTWSSVTWSKSS